MKEISRGAEARIYQTQEGIRKSRDKKSYRHPVLDTRLRQFRTRREATILSKIPIAAPKLLDMNDSEMYIDMEFIDGKQLRDVLTQENSVAYMKQLGTILKTLHEAGMVHGDLTTSNILVQDTKLILIDFGLSEFSDHVEEYAVDLHLLKHSLEAKHPNFELFEHVLNAYNPSEELSERFSQVEARGRYKHKT